MKKILILTGCYLPGYKDGGPVRTIINITEALGDEYEFYIACRDRDHGDAKPYDNIEYDAWNKVGKVKVWYVKSKGFSFRLIRQLSQSMDLVYSCGFYDDYGYKALILNRFKAFEDKTLVIAPMGTFSEGALAQKSKKKKIFIAVCKLGRLFKGVTWSVTSELEADDLKREVSKNVHYIVAEDLPRMNIDCSHGKYSNINHLKVIFLSRISPIKNLFFVAEILSHVQGKIDFDVYGIIEDEKYWEKCKSALDSLPDNIKYEYKGSIEPDCVLETFAQYDAFLFPTKGENYGHVIFEALAAGCIPVISRETPWNIIAERKAGFICRNDELEAYRKALEILNSMSDKEKKAMGEKGSDIAKEKIVFCKENTGYRCIFEESC